MVRRRRARTARLHYGLGCLLKALGASGLAASAFRDALAAWPDWFEAHLELGDALSRRRDWAGASVVFAQAVRLHPDSAESRGSLAVALARGGRIAASIEVLEALARQRPQDVEIHLVLGAMYRRAQRHDAAMRAYRWAVRLPGPPKGRRCELGEKLLGCRPWESVFAAYREAALLEPTVSASLPPAWHSCLNQHPSETRREFRRIVPGLDRAGTRGRRKAEQRGLRTLLRAPFEWLRLALQGRWVLLKLVSLLPTMLAGPRRARAAVKTFRPRAVPLGAKPRSVQATAHRSAS